MPSYRTLSFAFSLFLAAAAFGADEPTGSLDQHTLDKRTAPVLKELKLGDAALETKVKAVLEPHFQAMQTWHTANDAMLKQLWADWAAARNPSAKDEGAAAKVGEKIDAVYATFLPEHNAFLTKLAAVLSPEQVNAVKDSLTKTPGMERTYKAFLEIVPTFTDADKAFVHEKMAIAREQAMDAIGNKEKADIFKRQKVLVQDYIDTHGYDWKKSYGVFANKEKNAGSSAMKD